MKALGRGSIASFLKVILDIASVLLWVAGGAVALAFLAYLALLGGQALGLFALSPDWLRVHFVHASGDAHLSSLLVASGFVGALTMIIGAFVIVDRLKRLFASFVSDRPFSRENADHLRVIWVAMLALELLRYAIGLVVWLITAASGAETKHMTVHFELRLEIWFAIFTLMVLAEVFRAGARLREEQDLTI